MLRLVERFPAVHKWYEIVLERDENKARIMCRRSGDKYPHWLLTSLGERIELRFEFDGLFEEAHMQQRCTALADFVLATANNREELAALALEKVTRLPASQQTSAAPAEGLTPVAPAKEAEHALRRERLKAILDLRRPAKIG